MKLSEFVVLTCTAFVLFAVGVKALQNGHETADVIACKANLAVLAKGVVQYEETQGFLPPLQVVQGRGLPGWNLRLLPYIGHVEVHNVLVASGVYSISNALLPEQNSTNNWWTVATDPSDEITDRWGQRGVIFEALANVAEYRCPTRQPNAVTTGVVG